MRRRAMPINWPRRDPQHCRFTMPNSVWEYKLKPIEFLIFSYLCYRPTPGVLTPEMITADAHMTTSTAKKYLPVRVAMDVFYQRQLHQLELDAERRRVLRQQVEYGRRHPRAALCASASAPAAPDPS